MESKIFKDLAEALRTQIQDTTDEIEKKKTPLRLLIADLRSRQPRNKKRRYRDLTAVIREYALRYGEKLPADEAYAAEVVASRISEGRRGNAELFTPALLDYYWDNYKQSLYDLVRYSGLDEPAVREFLRVADQEQGSGVDRRPPTLRPNKLLDRPYNARDWEIGKHRIKREFESRTGRLDMSKLRIDSVPDEIGQMDWLQSLDFSVMSVTTLPPLTRLTRLRGLDCSYTQLERLPDLDCPSLEILWCGVSHISSLAPLEGYESLRGVYCGSTHVGDLSPLSSCKSLSVLMCEDTFVQDLSPLRGLPIKILECSDTSVSDLSPLVESENLEEIIFNGCDIERVPDEFWGLPNLRSVTCFGSKILGFPTHTLSRTFDDNCLSRLREFIRLRSA